MRAVSWFMQHDAKAYLHDVLVAIENIEKFLHGLNKQNYLDSDLVQSAVERQFIIIGEALNQVSRLKTVSAIQIGQIAAIVSFRNQIVHGYRLVNSSRVYDIAIQNLSLLKSEVQSILADGE